MQQHFYTVLILAAAIAAAGCGTTAEKEMPPPLVRTVTVGDASSTGDTGYAGTVRGRYETKLAFQVGGQILSRNVNVGTRVRAGDVLMVIDARDVQQKANAADAGVASARAQMQLARTNLARYEELYAAQAISAAALDQYRAQADAAEAAYRQAAAQSTEASNALGYTHLVAGADGVISNITVEEGQVVAAGQTVMTLTQEGAREIEIAVPESRLAEVSVGMPAAVALWANSAAYTGILRELSPVPDAATRTYTARIALTDAPADLPLGMTARVRLGASVQDGAAIPLSALYQTGDTAQVYVVEDDAVHLVPVTVTAFRTNDALVTGLPQGARIVTAGVHQLHEGEKVRTK
mgnify:CR=1 FL=1